MARASCIDGTINCTDETGKGYNGKGRLKRKDETGKEFGYIWYTRDKNTLDRLDTNITYTVHSTLYIVQAEHSRLDRQTYDRI